jgi:DNA-binding response OmpR family regulator
MLQAKRVLIVEDEALLAIMLEDELLEAGATVLGPATTVNEALRLIDSVTSDGGLSVAVLDIQLGDEVVLAVADRLAALDVPFVFATAYSEHCDTGGHAAPVLTKPFDPARLITVLEALTSEGT